MVQFKEGKNFNHRNTLSILRIKFEPDTEMGQRGVFCKGLSLKLFNCRSNNCPHWSAAKLIQFSTFKVLTRLNSFSLLLIKTKFLLKA